MSTKKHTYANLYGVSGENLGTSSVGTRLKRYRNRVGISAAKLAERLNSDYGKGSISRDIITNIENGRKSDVLFSDIVRLAHALQISPLALICDLEQPFLPADNPVFQGVSNYTVAYRFMANLDVDLPVPMEPMRRIYRATSAYYSQVKELTRNLAGLRDAVEGKTKYSAASDPSLNVFGPIVYETSCRYYLSEIASAQERLRKLNVILPDAEIAGYESAKTQIAKLSAKAKNSGLITAKDEAAWDEFGNSEANWINTDLDDDF